MNLENYKLLFETSQKKSNFPNWLKEKQNFAFEVFSKNGFPKITDEEWRYTNITPIEKTEFSFYNETILFENILNNYKNSNWDFIPIVNGLIQKDLIRISSEVIIETLSEKIAKNDAFAKSYFEKSQLSFKDSISNLNTAFLNEILFIKIPKNTSIEKPIHILNLQTENKSINVNSSRIVFLVKENSSVTLIEEFVSDSKNIYWNNSMMEIFISKEAKVEHVKLQNESENSFHTSNTAFYQDELSYLNSIAFSIGGKISRIESKVFLNGTKINSNLNGLYISAKNQLIDNHTFIEHKKENCESHELFKGILFDKSRSVFNGKIYVHSEAQKTDSKQSNKNLMLSDEATIDTKPQLEIFADDVKCTHGGTVGGLDKLSLFYLESRGVSADVAKGILTIGFASEVTELIVDKNIRKHIDAVLINRFRECIGNSQLPEIIHSN